MFNSRPMGGGSKAPSPNRLGVKGAKLLVGVGSPYTPGQISRL